jgi:hypothetical protein
LIQEEIDDIGGGSTSSSTVVSKRKLESEQPPQTPVINHPICFDIHSSTNLPDSLIESIIGYQSLKINQIVRLKLTSLLPKLNIELDAPNSPYSIFSLAISKNLQKSLTQLARSYLLLTNYLIDNSKSIIIYKILY